MENSNEREALAVFGVPFNKGQFCAVVGGRWSQPDPTAHGLPGFVEVGKVTRITVSPSLPGLHCYLELVRIYVGDQIASEMPLHNCEAVYFDIGGQDDG